MTDVSESSIQDASVRASRLAVLYSADAYANTGRKMGRQQSGLGLLPALIRATRGSHFPIAAARSENLVPLRALLKRVRPDLGLHLWPLDKLDHLVGVDGLFVSDPNIVRWAEGRQWHRQSAKSWSLVGLTHTLSSLGVAEILRKVPSSALQPWDALICTSRCARDAVQEVWNHEGEALSRRFGGQFSAWQSPLLPVIPLGCDFHYFEGLASDYAMARHSLSLPQEQPVVLSVGRLELHAKAHPGVLFQALKRVCQRRATHLPRPCLLIVGTSQSQITSQAWQQAVEHFSYWYDIRLIDGHSDQLTALAWSAADIFVSVADSHQETFGLTPVEAMARGLPVVATDWNGYRDTVIHGTTGYLIPTMQPRVDAPHRFADLSLGRLRYDTFMADLMQQVLVDEDALVAALERLLKDQHLRARMGQAGQRLVASQFTWDHVATRIYDLTERLTEIRRSAPPCSSRPPCSPWKQFRSWPTSRHDEIDTFLVDPKRFRERLDDLQRLEINSNLSIHADHELRLLALMPLVSLIHGLLNDRECSVVLSLRSLAAEIPEFDLPQLERSIVWLAKMGALELLP